MIDVADSSTSVDARVAVDRKDLLESEIELALARCMDKYDGPLKMVSH